MRRKILMKQLLFSVVFLFILSGQGLPVSAENQLKEAEIRSIAVEYFENLDGLTEEERKQYHFDEQEFECMGTDENGEAVWYVAFRDGDYVFNRYSFEVNGTTGEVSLLDTPYIPDPSYDWKIRVSTIIESAGDCPLSKEEILEQAQAYFLAVEDEVDGLTSQQREKYTVNENTSVVYELADHTPIWCVQYTSDVYSKWDIKDRYKFYINGYTGELVDFEHPEIPNPVNQWYSKLCLERNGDFVTWSIQQKYEFKRALETAQDEYWPMASWNNVGEINPYLVYLTLYDFQLPDENCITQEEAGQKALQYLSEKMNEELSEQFIKENYYVKYSFLNSTRFDKAGRLTWKVFFIPIDRIGYLSVQWQGPRCGTYIELDAHTGEYLGINPLQYELMDIDYIE